MIMQLMLSPHQVMPQAEAKKTNLPGSDPTKNAKALLRDSLPINNKPIRAIQVCAWHPFSRHRLLSLFPVISLPQTLASE